MPHTYVSLQVLVAPGSRSVVVFSLVLSALLLRGSAAARYKKPHVELVSMLGIVVFLNVVDLPIDSHAKNLKGSTPIDKT